MELGAYTYFYVILGGFGLVWSFRKGFYGTKEKEKLGDFEYLGFSAFWGVMILGIFLPIIYKGLFNGYRGDVGSLSKALSNPLAFGAGIFAIMLAIGYGFGKIFRELKDEFLK